jgi:D-aminopeptidase
MWLDNGSSRAIRRRSLDRSEDNSDVLTIALEAGDVTRMSISQNLITDVAGVRVGNAHEARLMSGVTAILFDGATVASAVTRGGAPGGRDTGLLKPEMTAPGVHAVVLSGGSAFGLDAAGGVAGVLRQRNVGFEIGSARVPLVVQAITFDLLNGGDKTWGRMPPYWELGWQAAEAARDGAFDLGSAGGGFGCTTANCRGGLGSASAVTSRGYRVGAIALVNAVGTVTVGDGPHFWAAPFEIGAEFGGLGFPARMPVGGLDLRMKGGAPPSTTIALVVTDAILTKAEAKRLAIMADDGLGKAVRPAHAPMDGDTVFAVSTLGRPLDNGTQDLTEIGMAAGDCLARAIARGVYEAAETPAGWAGPPAYRQRFPRTSDQSL